MRRLILAALLLWTCTTAAPVAGGESRAAFDFRAVGRIELACRIGVGKAESEEEALACLRWRNSALAAIVGTAYQATVAWLSDRGELAGALEEEQGVWLAEFGAMPGETREQLEAGAAFLRRRLAAFMAITEGSF